MPARRPRKAPRNAKITRGGWVSTGTAAGRRASAASASEGKAARTRERLLAAARTAFARHGYARTTVDHIVEEAGVARGSFYTYFESKAHLFRHLSARIDARIARDVVAFDRVRGSDPIANLSTANRNYLEVVGELADLYRVVDDVAAHDASVRSARLKSRRQHVARVEKAIRRWQTRGCADPNIDPHLTAAALVSMLSGFAQWLHGCGENHDSEAALAVVNAIWVKACGLSAEPRASGDVIGS